MGGAESIPAYPYNENYSPLSQPTCQNTIAKDNEAKEEKAESVEEAKEAGYKMAMDKVAEDSFVQGYEDTMVKMSAVAEEQGYQDAITKLSADTYQTGYDNTVRILENL